MNRLVMCRRRFMYFTAAIKTRRYILSMGTSGILKLISYCLNLTLILFVLIYWYTPLAFKKLLFVYSISLVVSGSRIY